MQITVEITSQLGRRLRVEIPEEKVLAAVDKRIDEIARTARIDGFRPGKVPKNVVRQRFGKPARQEAVANLIQESMEEAIKTERLFPAAMPTLEELPAETGPLKYTALFEVYPEIDFVGLSGANFEKEVSDIKESDVDLVIEKMRTQRTEWVEVQRPAQKRDQVEVSFEGRLEGELFEGGTAKDFRFVIGEGRMLKDFEDGAIGAAPGETREINVAFPEDYQQETLKGKTAQFKLEIHKVFEPKLPELNDDFPALFDVKKGGMEQLRKEVRENMGRELQQRVTSRLRENILNKLLELNVFDVPKATVSEQILDEKRAFLSQLMGGRQAIKPEFLSLVPDEQFQDKALRRVRTGLLFAHLIEKQNITVDPEKVRKKVKEITAVYDNQDEMISWFYSQKRELEHIENIVLEEQVIEFLLKDAVVTEKQISYVELMGIE